MSDDAPLEEEAPFEEDSQTSLVAPTGLLLTIVSPDITTSGTPPLRTLVNKTKNFSIKIIGPHGEPVTDPKFAVRIDGAKGDARFLAATTTSAGTTGQFEYIAGPTAGSDTITIDGVARINGIKQEVRSIVVGVYIQAQPRHTLFVGSSPLINSTFRFDPGVDSISALSSSSFQSCPVEFPCSLAMPDGSWKLSARSELEGIDALETYWYSGYTWEFLYRDPQPPSEPGAPEMPNPYYRSPVRFTGWTCNDLNANLSIKCGNDPTNKSTTCTLPNRGANPTGPSERVQCTANYADITHEYPSVRIAFEYPYPSSSNIYVEAFGAYNRLADFPAIFDKFGKCNSSGTKPGCGGFKGQSAKRFKPGDRVTLRTDQPLITSPGAVGMLGWKCQSQYQYVVATPSPGIVSEFYNFRACKQSMSLDNVPMQAGHQDLPGYGKGLLTETKCSPVWGMCFFGNGTKDNFGGGCLCGL